MNILFTSKYDSKNQYVRLIVDELKPFASVECTPQKFWELDASFDVVHIQWCEELFEWQPVSSDDLSRLELMLLKWKRNGIKLVATYHNEKSHREWSNDDRLYDLVFKYIDGIVHLGDYSYKLNPVAGVRSTVIPHPLYRTPDFNLSRFDTNTKLGLKERDNYLISFGAIRSYGEFNTLIKGFSLINDMSNLKLVVLNGHRDSSLFNRLYRILARFPYLWRVFGWKKIVFKSGYVSDSDLASFIEYASAVVVTRVNTLNSGLVYKALSQNKMIVGPNVGNITELLSSTGNYGYQAGNALSLSENILIALDNLSSTNFDVRDFAPHMIAKKHLQFYEEILEG